MTGDSGNEMQVRLVEITSGAEAVVAHQSSTPDPHHVPPTQAVRSMQDVKQATRGQRGRPLILLHPNDGDPRHGTPGGYSNHQCRCDLCREANNAYIRDLKRRKREARDA
jgi:hypothetical protein